MTTTSQTQFRTASRALAQWEGRTVSIYFQHEPSGDGIVSCLSGLTIDQVRREDDHSFSGDALRVSLSFGGSPIGSVMVYEDLLREVTGDLGGIECRMNGAMVALYEDDGEGRCA